MWRRGGHGPAVSVVAVPRGPGVRDGLLRAGVAEHVVDYLVGHSKGATAQAYVPESAPETSPYWPHLLEVVGQIPVYGRA